MCIYFAQVHCDLTWIHQKFKMISLHLVHLGYTCMLYFVVMTLVLLVFLLVLCGLSEYSVLVKYR